MNRPWLVVVLAVVVAAIVGAKFYFGRDPYHEAQAGREIATRVLAETLAARHPGKSAIVLSNPFIKRPETDRRIVAMEEAGVQGLRKGKLTIQAVVYPELRPEARDNPRAALPPDADTTTPLSYLVATNAFDLAAADHPQAEIFVSLIGLPIALDQCEVWKKAGPPSFALLLPDLRMLGGVGPVIAAFKSGKLSAIVVRRPDAVDEDKRPGPDVKAEFEKRFVLVTGENVEQVARQSPELLQSQ